jgi:hypothetical protein
MKLTQKSGAPIPSTGPTQRMKLAQLAEISPGPSFLTPHPTALRLTFATNAPDIWSALREESAPPILACCLEPQATLVWRQDVTARFRPLGPEEAMMWNEAASDTRFDVLYEMVATYGGEDGADFRAASYLKDWVDMGGLADRRLSS